MTTNFATAAGKVLVGLLSLSFFFVVSGLYSFGIGICKQTFFKGLEISGGDRKKEITYYFRMAVLLLISSAVYIAYMVRLFFFPSVFQYGTILGISIATLSFVDLGLAIRGLAKSNRKNDLLISGLKTVNFSGALIALVLTQTALLSFTHEVTPETVLANSQSSASLGIVMGGVSCILAIVMIIKSLVEKKNDSHETRIPPD